MRRIVCTVDPTRGKVTRTGHDGKDYVVPDSGRYNELTDIGQQIYDVVADVCDSDLRCYETIYHTDELTTIDSYNREEANMIVRDVDRALREAGLRKYVTKITSYYSEWSDRPDRIAVSLKRAVSTLKD